MQQAFGHGAHVNNAFGAYIFARPAPHALVLVHHGIAIRSHIDGIKGTGLDAVPHPQATDAANSLAAVKRIQGPTGVDPHVMESILGPQATLAVIFRYLRLGAARIHTHDRRNIGDTFHIGNDAHPGRRFTRHDCHGRGGTGSVPATTAIGTGQMAFHFCYAGVFPNIKYLGSNAQNSPAEGTNAK